MIDPVALKEALAAAQERPEDAAAMERLCEEFFYPMARAAAEPLVRDEDERKDAVQAAVLRMWIVYRMVSVKWNPYCYLRKVATREILRAHALEQKMTRGCVRVD